MIYISGKRDSLDVLTKLDLQGNIQWETIFSDAWNQSYPDSRATPTIEDGRIYITGGLGAVVCMDTQSGDIIWKVNPHKQFEGEFHSWGQVESPLLTQNAVISSPIGKRTAMVALDKKDGSLLWKSKSLGGGKRSYASPLLINHNGRKMILGVSSSDFFAIDPDDGDLIWSTDIKGYSSRGRARIITNTPVYHNGDVLVTNGYNDEGMMFTISPDGNKAKIKWHNANLDVHHGGVVLLDGYIYGANWINNGLGNWVCQDWETGKVMYEEKWNNKGSIIFADGRLYIYEEKQGNVGLVEPTPEGFRLISSFKVEGGSGPYWAHMSIYDKKLFIRHGSVLFVYDIAQ
jgi:outer membrane protein assembly factor BamB